MLNELLFSEESLLTTADFGKKKYSIVGNVGFPRKDALWMIILMCLCFVMSNFGLQSALSLGA